MRLAGLALLLAAASADAATFRGVVVDRLTGAPVAGARVAARSGEATSTGPDGAFALEGPAATRELHIERAGYLVMRLVNLDGAPVLAELWPERGEPAPSRGEQDGDADELLRPEAREAIRRSRLELATVALVGAPPATIRVWRRKLDGSTSSCTGRVDVIPFEDYVKGVVPNEWIPSWDDKALAMGAVCARTFAWWWVVAGGKYPCADVDDTTASQVYKDTRVARTDAAVDRTRGVAIVKSGSLVLAEYSAENGDPTKFGVAEPYCTGQTVFGHGRGTCQWGTQRWATKEGKDHEWMAAHYYPGAEAVALGKPAYAATYVRASYPARMRAGEEATAVLEFENAGTETWDDSVRIVTERASPFFVAGDWVDPSTPGPADAAAPPGGAATFTFRIRAPALGETSTLTEPVAVDRDGETMAAAVLTIEVSAAEVPPPELDDGDVTGGCGVGAGGAPPILGLALLFLSRRSRRKL